MNNYEKDLLIKVKENNLDNKFYYPNTLMARLRQLCPEWSDIMIEEIWKSLIDKGCIKEVSLKVVMTQDALNNIDQYVADKGSELFS